MCSQAAATPRPVSKGWRFMYGLYCQFKKDYVSEFSENESSHCVSETCSYLFASSEAMKCRLLTWLLDHTMIIISSSSIIISSSNKMYISLYIYIYIHMIWIILIMIIIARLKEGESLRAGHMKDTKDEPRCALDGSSLMYYLNVIFRCKISW